VEDLPERAVSDNVIDQVVLNAAGNPRLAPANMRVPMWASARRQSAADILSSCPMISVSGIGSRCVNSLYVRYVPTCGSAGATSSPSNEDGR
jgi:hypothetical protein